jgi:hypothetical protein
MTFLKGQVSNQNGRRDGAPHNKVTMVELERQLVELRAQAAVDSKKLDQLLQMLGEQSARDLLDKNNE